MAKNKKNSNSKKGKKKTFLSKVLIFFGVIVLISIALFVMKYYFVEKSYIKINMSTDKKLEYIILEGEKELISTQKYVSDLEYSMRYDIDNFKVFKYKEQDIYKFLHNDMVLVVVEKASLPSSCSVSILETGYNSCYVKVNNFTEEYYISSNGRTYKVTVKSPDTTEYEEGAKVRISYMINSFEMKF